MLIHPVILYILYTLLLVIIFKNFSKFHAYKNNNKQLDNYILLILLLLSLFLGSYWAEQELFWGGW